MIDLDNLHGAAEEADVRKCAVGLTPHEVFALISELRAARAVVGAAHRYDTELTCSLEVVQDALEEYDKVVKG